MKLWVWIWIGISILFEVAGDYFVKTAANALGENSKWLWVITLLFYNLMLISWMFAMQNSKQLTIPGVCWLVACQLVLVFLGLCVFHEQVTLHQKIGIGLSILSVTLLSV